MTKISYIHGIGIPQDEWVDRSANVPEKSFIDYANMTDGQLRLALIREQLGILAGYYPEDKQWLKGYNQLSDYLSSGVSGQKIGEKYLIPFLKNEISRAKWMTQKASSVNGLLVPMEDCNRYENMFEDPYGNITRNIQEPEYTNCLRDNRYKKLLNEHLEETSHHVLYRFVENPNLEPNVVATKSVSHKLAIQKLCQITGLSESNMTTWIRTGILRTNSKHGAPVMQPEKTIETMRIGIPYQEAERVGEPISVTLIALAKVLGAITAAIAAAKALLGGMEPTDRQKMESASNYFGLNEFGPGESDYENWGNNSGNGTGGGSGNGGNGGTGGGDFLSTLTSPDNLPLVVGGVAALYYFQNK